LLFIGLRGLLSVKYDKLFEQYGGIA